MIGEERIVLDIPGDRYGAFDPALIPKYRRQLLDFDDMRAVSTRDSQAHVGELYGVELSANRFLVVTDSVMAEVAAWQNKSLEATYAIVYFDALRVTIRDEDLVRIKSVYWAIGVRCCGHKEVLGLWIEQTKGAKFWRRVMTELRNRGITDILIAVVDGLEGFPGAMTAVFPETVVQTCLEHVIRYSMAFEPIDKSVRGSGPE